jgi:probable F420-dependent oxidoreductase
VTAAPFLRSGPEAALDLAGRAGRLGYGSFWVAEVNGTEAFSVLGAVSRSTPAVGLGTGVLPVQVRTPPLLAMAAASLQELAPGRDILLGIGVSSPVVAGDWHGAGYTARPLARMREFITLLRECLSGQTVTFEGDFYQVRNFRLGVELGELRPKIIVGALGEGMLRLAGQEADGVLLNYLPASHVPWCIEQVRRGGNAVIYANIHVGVGDRAAAAARARRDLFSYAVVDAYARSFARSGFGGTGRPGRARRGRPGGRARRRAGRDGRRHQRGRQPRARPRHRGQLPARRGRGAGHLPPHLGLGRGRRSRGNAPGRDCAGRPGRGTLTSGPPASRNPPAPKESRADWPEAARRGPRSRR